MAPKRLPFKNDSSSHNDDEDVSSSDDTNITPTEHLSNSHNAQATTSLVKRGKTSINSGVSGWIESVELFDFMCHRHLLINLCANINFIVGNNGSGKSAILTALTVCLGGRASVSQRGNSVENLIREGAPSGKVKIKIYNGGDSPYQPEVYGEHILIERSFKREGTNSYSIYGANNRLIAGRREEVNCICDHFGIQVDNPLAVLTQETAKKFLANAKPKDLYEFFIKATQLEQLSIDYTFAADKISESRIRLEQLKQSLRPMREEISKLERQLSDLERLKVAHQNIQSLRRELTWAMVEEKEREYELAKRNLEEEESRLLEVGERIIDMKEKHARLKEQIHEMESSLGRDQTEKLDPLMGKRGECQQKLRSTDQQLNELILDAKNINTEFKALREQMDALDERIKQENDNNSSGNDRESKMRGRLEEIDREIINLNNSAVDTQRQEELVTKGLEQVQQKVRGIKDKKGEVERLMEGNKRMLHDAERLKGDRVRGFGERMPAVLASIKKNSSSFSRPPVGPAGLFVKVKDEKWSVALQVILNNNLEAFAVHNHEDRSTLQRILTENNLHNPIVVLDFDTEMDISGGVPDSHYLTALKVLDITNPVVKKLFIFLSEIESIVLIEDRHSAMETVKQRPKNVSAVYTTNARMKAGGRSISVTQLYLRNTASHLIEDGEGRIKAARRKGEELQNQDKTISRDYDLAMREEKSLNDQINNLREMMNDDSRKLRLIRTEARSIQEQLREQKETTVSQSIFEEERREAEGKMASFSSQFQVNNQQQENLRSQKATLASNLAQLDSQIANVKENQEALLKTITDSVRSSRTHEKDILALEQRKAREQSEYTKQQEKGLSKSAELGEMRDAACKVCNRISVTKSVQELDRDLTAQEECLRNNQYGQLDPIKVKEDLEGRRVIFRESEKSIQVNERLLVILNTSLEKRQRGWEDFRRSIAVLSCLEFIFNLNTRGFQGSLEYRHHDAELHIHVIPQGQQQPQPKVESNSSQKKRRSDSTGGGSKDENENRDVKQLSGGEKSYSTACFLFSLWQAMGSPIRCLDEFDVYMDPVNRNFILEVLVSHARASRVQFILITPNTIPDSYRAPDIRTCRLRDPERGQKTIV